MKLKTTIVGNIKDIQNLCEKYNSKFYIILDNEDLSRLDNALNNIGGEGTMEELLAEDDLGLNEMYNNEIPLRIRQAITTQYKKHVGSNRIRYHLGTTVMFYTAEKSLEKEFVS